MTQKAHFVVSGGELLIVDPSYRLEAGLPLKNCANGGWTATMEPSRETDTESGVLVEKKIRIQYDAFAGDALLEPVPCEVEGDRFLIGVYDVESLDKSEPEFEGIYKRLSTGSLALMDGNKDLASVDGGVVIHWDGAIQCLVGRDDESRIVQLVIECVEEP